MVATGQDLKYMRNSCQLAGNLLSALRAMLRPGLETRELDSCAEWQLVRWGARSAFKGYRGYPAHVCVSVNDEIVHGIPGKRKLKDGDIVSLDVGVLQDGFYGDTAASSAVGDVDEQGRRLMEATEGALFAGIAYAKAGNHVSDISHAIQEHVEKAGYSVVKEFVGHGIGREMHEEPQVPNYGQAGHGLELRNGHILAIEPMVNEGTASVRVLEDGWTAVTGDGGRSAHFEHTVLVTYGAPEILTLAQPRMRS